MLAHDTRPSARDLVAAAAAGVAVLGGVAVPCGLLTTPQLHWMVRQANAAAKHDEAAYFGALAAGFAALVARAPAPTEVRGFQGPVGVFTWGSRPCALAHPHR